MTNEELIIAFQQGDVSFDQVYHQCHRLIFKETNKWHIKGLEREDIESLGMEAFYEACLNFDPTRGVKFSTHSTTHIHYRLRNEYNKTKLEKHGGFATFLSSNHDMTTADRKQYEAGLLKFWKETQESVEWNIYLDLIQRALDTMGETQRHVMERHIFNNEDQYEIARSMNTTNQRIHYHVKEGFKKIRNQFQQAGWTMEL